MPIKPRKMPSREIVRMYLSYSPITGIVTKNLLPREALKSDRAYSIHSARDAGKVVGSKNKHGYLFAMINGVTYPLHRLIWVLMEGDIPDGMYVDHRNGVRDDNRWENIKDLVDWGQNQRNAAIRKDNKTGYKGVCKLPSGKYWARAKNQDGKQIGLGTYDTPEKAYEVVMTYNVENFGKYARTGATTRRTT